MDESVSEEARTVSFSSCKPYSGIKTFESRTEQLWRLPPLIYNTPQLWGKTGLGTAEGSTNEDGGLKWRKSLSSFQRLELQKQNT